MVPNNRKARVIAYYLPQFHPIPENDHWWGKGFTEWTNVGKAKPLFKGHYQPRVPADLGYYDLRLASIREEQAELAREAGIEGFCYWHYWFGNGKRLMANIFQEVLESGKPDFPFSLAWANHSWFSKNWNSDGTSTNKLLIEQTYPGLEDAKEHFDFLLKAFHDDRYIKVDGRPFFLIFDPSSLPDEYIDYFQKTAKASGFKDGLYLVANITHESVSKQILLDRGFSAVTYQRIGVLTNKTLKKMGRFGRGVNRVISYIKSILYNRPPRVFNYSKHYKDLIIEEDRERCVIPNIIPQWDHTPRSGWNGSLFINSTPEAFGKHVLHACEAIKNKPKEEQILLLKSWNEWGEGNYIEPDLKHGKAYINELKNALNSTNNIV